MMCAQKDESAEANPLPLQRLFKDSSMAKLLDFLTVYKDFDYSKTEISENSGVSWRTLHRIWAILEKYDLVTKTRQIGRATLYKLNVKNPIAQTLHKLAFQIATFDVNKIVAEELTREQKGQNQSANLE